MSNQDRPKAIILARSLELREYTGNKLLRLPKTEFSYLPTYPSPFATRGEGIIGELLKATPVFSRAFNRLYPVPFQAEVASATFKRMQREFKDGIAGDPAALERNKGGYFMVNRRFSRLVPEQYKRTVAPRITSTGSTLHGMRKTLQLEILKQLTLPFKSGDGTLVGGDHCFIDIDMSACHSRVAASLMLNSESQISISLEDGEFWKKQVAWARPRFAGDGVNLGDDEIKKLLKVMLYTSINGGNPANDNRVLDNLSKNAKEYLALHGLNTALSIENDTIFQSCKATAAAFGLASELKDLNKICSSKGSFTDAYYTFTIDRCEPYVEDSQHFGISRVLQGFEVILLCYLVKLGLREGGIPVSLDHDGALFMFDKDVDVEKVMKRLNEGFLPYADHLLQRELPLDVKRIVVDGKET